MPYHPIVGTWNLVTMEHRDPSGKVRYPMGKEAIGQLIYSPDGYMAASIMKADRKPFHTQGLFDGTLKERAHACETYVTYAGRYRTEKNSVFHLVEVSLFPNWVGSEQHRLFQIDGDKLSLSTPPFRPFGKDITTAHIYWQRAIPLSNPRQ